MTVYSSTLGGLKGGLKGVGLGWDFRGELKGGLRGDVPSTVSSPVKNIQVGNRILNHATKNLGTIALPLPEPERKFTTLLIPPTTVQKVFPRGRSFAKRALFDWAVGFANEGT